MTSTTMKFLAKDCKDKEEFNLLISSAMMFLAS